MVCCPLGLVDNCQSNLPSGRGCINFNRCHDQVSLTLTLPYTYWNNCLTVDHTRPQLFRHSNFNPVVYAIENYHQLSQDAEEEMIKLGFAAAVPNPNFDADVWANSEFNNKKYLDEVF